MDGRHAVGLMWFVRCSLDAKWPETFMNRELNCLKVHFVSFTQRASLTNTDKQSPLTNDNAREKRSKRKAAKQVSESSSFVSEGYQDQGKPDKAHIARMLASNWGDRPLASHPKWPEFSTWCRKQGGKANAKGFWTWLAGQKRYWRDKVKVPDEIDGYDLDGKFYPAAEANLMLARNSKLDGKFQHAVKLPDGTHRIL
jgi:hypothetical protein